MIAMNTSLPLMITGAAGFVGARIVESCNTKKIPVISVDRPEFFTSRPEHAGLNFGEIVDLEKCSEWLERKTQELGHAPVRAIVHMGACTDTTEYDVAYLTRMNLDYTKMLWKFCAKTKTPLYYASSAATYGAGELGYDDDESITGRLKPLNPYGESKRAFDEWALAEEKKGHHPPNWAGFKFFNVYGFGEGHKGKMASVIFHGYHQMKQTGLVKLFQSHKAGIAHGEQKRDFIFVDDIVNVIHFALAKPLVRGVYNLGSGKARSFHDLAKATFRAAGIPENIEFIPMPEELRGRYQYFTEASMGKLRTQGYTTPFTELEDGVRQYVERLNKAAQTS